MLQLPWDVAGGVPRPETRHVAFAADLYDQRWALVAGARDDGTVVGTWFFAWASAEAKNLRASGPAQVVAPDQPLTAVRGGTSESPVVVVAAPGDVVEISGHTEVDNVGTISRTYESLETVDGVAITSIPSTPDCTICGASVRVSRTGQQLFRGAPLIQGGTYVTPDLDSIAFADLRRSADAVPEPRWIADGFFSLATPLGIPINELSPNSCSPDRYLGRPDGKPSGSSSRSLCPPAALRQVRPCMPVG